MLASDLNNPNFVGATNPDSLLHVRFYLRSEQDFLKSEKEGKPVFFETPYITIMTPGNQLSQLDVPVREEHKFRFPIQWAQFQNSQTTEQVVGTPVEQWPAISRSQADELKGIKFFTVEQIAGASDQQIQRLGMNGNMLKQKAQAFLTLAKDSALAQSQAVELVKKDEQIKSLQDSLNALTEQVNGLVNKPKRKYTKKNKVDETA